MAHEGVGESSEHNVRLSQLLDLSDDELKKQFDIPRGAYIDKPRKRAVEDAWNKYLQSNNYSSAFASLEDTERDRYRSIIEEVRAEERMTHQFALETFRIIYRGKPLNLDGILDIDVVSRLRQGVIKLHRYMKQKSKHIGREVEFSGAEYLTKFGVFTACFSLPQSWYVGHCPGDPIVRIVGDPDKPGFDPGDMFYVPELAGREDGDGPEWFDVLFEGVVPFNAREVYRRFTRDAFPAFLRMAIAAVGFDPRDQNHGAHPWATRIEYAQTAGFAELPERDRANILKLLRRIWQVKYGTKTNQYPGFLIAQLAKSMSRLREMGWLMTQIEHGGHQYAEHHYWTHCKCLLKDITGFDAASLADQYRTITLAEETERLLHSGDVGHILFYKPSKESRAIQKLDEVYNSEGPDHPITLDLREVRELCDKAIKTLYDKKSRPKSPFENWKAREAWLLRETSA
ncbi:hypothetical protein F5B17DRAFT_425788 [Nemania serpens]|nr:hypothetical protein F5B17DRAFT_425788 [Nemania serpens]